MDNAWKKKLVWIKTLQIGDVVCDCRFKHLRISTIIDVNRQGMDRVSSWFIRHLGFLPDLILFDVIDRFIHLRPVASILNYVAGDKLIDRDLILEDGMHCSAIHCCDPADHAHRRNR